MERFITSAMVGTLVCTCGVLVDSDRDGTLLIFPVTGFFLSAALLALVFLPLRWMTRRFVTHSNQRIQASVVGAFLLFLIGVLTVCLPETGLTMSRQAFGAFWSTYVIALLASFFWPLAAQGNERTR